MSGHSKWSNIKNRKGKQDAEKGKVFTKISKEIIVAVKQGGPDPDGNFRLKLMIQKAKAANMPNDNIKRSIEKASGVGEGNSYEEFTYEGYGPAGTAILLDIMTDNRNRTASEIRYIFSRNGGNLGETGCVGWMFNRRGRMILDMEGRDEDEIMMIALDAGADDFSVEDGKAEIITMPEDLETVRKALSDSGYEVEEADVLRIPENTVLIDNVNHARAVLKLYDLLDDHDDVNAAYANFEIPDEILAQLEE